MVWKDQLILKEPRASQTVWVSPAPPLFLLGFLAPTISTSETYLEPHSQGSLVPQSLHLGKLLGQSRGTIS